MFYIFNKTPHEKCFPKYVDSGYLEVQETVWNTLRYPYLDISDLQN